MAATGVVTPEGVYLDYRPAGLATRTFGRLIDLSLVVLIAYFAFTLLLIVVVSGAETLFIILAVVMGFLLLFGYPIAFEVFGGGRTLGHRATGTRVVRTDGGPIRFRHAAIRAMLFLVDGLATSGFAGAVAVLTTAKGQRLGDLAAGTMVVRLDRATIADAGPLLVSRDLAVRAASYDRRRVGEAELTAARLLLERGSSMRPGAQLDLANRVAARLDEALGGVRRDDDPVNEFIGVVVSPPAAPTADDDDARTLIDPDAEEVADRETTRGEVAEVEMGEGHVQDATAAGEHASDAARDDDAGEDASGAGRDDDEGGDAVEGDAADEADERPSTGFVAPE